MVFRKPMRFKGVIPYLEGGPFHGDYIKLTLEELFVLRLCLLPFLNENWIESEEREINPRGSKIYVAVYERVTKAYRDQYYWYEYHYKGLE